MAHLAGINKEPALDWTIYNGLMGALQEMKEEGGEEGAGMGRSHRGWVGHAGKGGVGHAGVGWVMLGGVVWRWDGHVGVGWGGSCRGGVRWVIQGCGQVDHTEVGWGGS